jgi:hypothetical protein
MNNKLTFVFFSRRVPEEINTLVLRTDGMSLSKDGQKPVDDRKEPRFTLSLETDSIKIKKDRVLIETVLSKLKKNNLVIDYKEV